MLELVHTTNTVFMNQNIYVKWQPLNISLPPYKQIAFFGLFFFFNLKESNIWGLLYRPLVKASPYNAGGVGLIPCQGVRILHCLVAKKTKHKQYCNKFNKDFKNGPH